MKLSRNTGNDSRSRRWLSANLGRNEKGRINNHWH